jgi:peptidoglycan/LPS O-acetylase OafA/YrhL
MVSGFLILQSFDRSSSWWNFLKKRIPRIYPGCLIAVSICVSVMRSAKNGELNILLRAQVALTFQRIRLLPQWNRGFCFLRPEGSLCVELPSCKRAEAS